MSDCVYVSPESCYDPPDSLNNEGNNHKRQADEGQTGRAGESLVIKCRSRLKRANLNRQYIITIFGYPNILSVVFSWF